MHYQIENDFGVTQVTQDLNSFVLVRYRIRRGYYGGYHEGGFHGGDDGHRTILTAGKKGGASGKGKTQK